MKSLFFTASIFLGCWFFKAPLFGQDSATAPKIEWTGLAALEEGQFVKCEYDLDKGPMPFRPWLTNVYARIGMKAIVNPHLTFAVIPEIKLWDDTWDWGHNGSPNNNPFNQHATVSLADAEGTFSFGNKDAFALNISLGVIPYKYDAEAKNLGEYLFRTGEHPAFIETSFDQAYATLTGLRVNTEILKKFSLDLFFTTETQFRPINDLSLSLLLGYKLPGYLDLGAGIMFDRLIPLSGELFKPYDTEKNNIYESSTGQIDTFSWGGTKVMARLSFDPKGFLPSNISNIFGKEDCKIYGEVAILGMTNIIAYMDSLDVNGQPVQGHEVIDSSKNFYSNIWQRIPIMFGFNIPTFRLLDYLSIEGEWYGWPYSPNLYNFEDFFWILPKPNGIGTGSKWKFSFNLKKTVWDHVSIIGQIARDHTRHDVYYTALTDVNEIFQKQDEWGWWLKLQYNF